MIEKLDLIVQIIRGTMRCKATTRIAAQPLISLLLI